MESIHPGVLAEDVAESTGFDLGDLSRVPVTPAPSAEELDILRHEVDPNHILLD